MKKYFIRALCTALTLALCSFPAFAADIHVTKDGRPVIFSDATPYLSPDNRTMLPLRAVGEALGCQVGWNSNNEIVRVLSPVYAEQQQRDDEWPWVQVALYLKPGYKPFLEEYAFATTDGPVKPINLFPSPATADSYLRSHRDEPERNWVLVSDVAPVVRNGRTYLPIRAVAELCGFAVDWDEATQTVAISSMGEPQPTYLTETNDAQTLNDVVDTLFPCGDNGLYG
ncbi:MAG: copper amine oxidase N-terminal domain-containing protein [Intestinibacillus sp.]